MTCIILLTNIYERIVKIAIHPMKWTAFAITRTIVHFLYLITSANKIFI